MVLPILGLGLESAYDIDSGHLVGGRFSAELQASGVLRFGMSGSVYLPSPYRRWYVEDFGPGTTPIIERRWQGSAQVGLMPLSQEEEDRARSFGGYVGAGVLSTAELYEPGPGVEMASGHPDELMKRHTVLCYGLLSEVWWGDLGARLRLEMSRHEYKETHVTPWLGVDVVWAPRTPRE